MKENTLPSVKISASIHTDKKPRGAFEGLSGLMPALVKFFIIFGGCAGSVFTFTSCVDIDKFPAVTVIVIALSSAVCTFIFGMKKRYYAVFGSIFAAAFTVWVYAFRNGICAGMAGMANAYMAKINRRYRAAPFIPIAEPELAETHMRLFICFAVILMCALAAHAAFRTRSSSGVCFATCAPVFSVLMFGMEPSGTAFFSAVVCWAAMFALEANAAGSISDKRFKKYAAYCGLYAAIISAVCIIAVSALSKALGYERPERLNEIYDQTVDYVRGGSVQQVIDEIVTITSGKSAATGAINHGRLGEFDEISFSGKTVLEVTIPKSDETIYLRGFVGSVYTGSSWKELSSAQLDRLEEITSSFDTEGLSPLLLDGYNLKYTRAEIPKYSFTVKNTAANNHYFYMPYNLVPESVARYGITDGSGFTGASGAYIGQFYDPRSYYGYQNIMRKRWSVPSALSEDEAVYRQFVYENYLNIPDSFVSTEIFDESYYQYITAEEVKTGKSTLDEMTVFSRKLYFIKKWLRDNCEYSLSTEKLHAGEDFVNSFLDRRTGSCSHFASAAVIMCRYAGIPARYAEGYVIKPADFPAGTETGKTASVEVTDARGHAWAEVYIDGFGWYPVEFTSGYGNVRTALPTDTAAAETEASPETPAVSEIAGEETSSPPRETTVIQNTSEAETESSAVTAAPEETTAAPVTSAANDETEAPSVGFGIFGIKGDKKADVFYDLTLAAVLVIAAAAVPVIFIVRRNIVLSKRRKAAYFSAETGVMDDYRRFEKLMKLMEMPEQGQMSFAEYSRALSERSEMLSDGTAELVIRAALKASFGGGSLTRSEANETRLAVNSLAKRFCGTLSGFGRFKLKFLYCII